MKCIIFRWIEHSVNICVHFRDCKYVLYLVTLYNNTGSITTLIILLWINTNGLSVPYREIWEHSVISWDRHSIHPSGFDSRYTLTPHHLSIGVIKKMLHNSLKLGIEPFMRCEVRTRVVGDFSSEGRQPTFILIKKNQISCSK